MLEDARRGRNVHVNRSKRPTGSGRTRISWRFLKESHSACSIFFDLRSGDGTKRQITHLNGATTMEETSGSYASLSIDKDVIPPAEAILTERCGEREWIDSPTHSRRGCPSRRPEDGEAAHRVKTWPDLIIAQSNFRVAACHTSCKREVFSCIESYHRNPPVTVSLMF